MYYLTDIDANNKVNTIVFLPSEAHINFLGWDKTIKQQTGIFVEDLPVANVGNYTSITLYVDENKNPYWCYGKLVLSPLTTEDIAVAIAELDAQREADKLEVQTALAELAETLLGGN